MAVLQYYYNLLLQLTAPNEMRRDGRRMYNDMTLRQLQQWTDSGAIESPVVGIYSITLLIYYYNLYVIK